MVMVRRLLLLSFLSSSILLMVAAQSVPPAGSLPQAINTPRPEYRPEWAKQGLAGKGVVLVTIDPKTGNVTGVRMLQSTGNQLLDGAALQAYSQWRFKPGSVAQVKMPIEFTTRTSAQTLAPARKRSSSLYYVPIVIGVVALFAILKRKKA